MKLWPEICDAHKGFWGLWVGVVVLEFLTQMYEYNWIMYWIWCNCVYLAFWQPNGV